MSVCVFKTKELKRCIEHALNSKVWQMGYAVELAAAPGLFLVHDEGVYLMSNGEPGDVDSGEMRLYVAYAQGCNPDKDDDWWDTARELVGGDDFADIIVIKPEWLKACDEFDEFCVKVTPSEILTRFGYEEEAPV